MASLNLMMNQMLRCRPEDKACRLSEHTRRRWKSRRRRNDEVHTAAPPVNVVVGRLFGPAIFEASKLKVVYLGGVDEKKHPGKVQRTYTLTHSDITSTLTLAISNTINNSQLQGWYNRFQRDEVVAEWKKIKGKMYLHVHCHISGGHFLLDLFARLRYYIFCKELPVVLMAFVHADSNLLANQPDLQHALVYVQFHSNLPEFNRLECWGPLSDASAPQLSDSSSVMPLPCPNQCDCCFPPMSMSNLEPPNWPQNHIDSSDAAMSSDQQALDTSS